MDGRGGDGPAEMLTAPGPRPPGHQNLAAWVGLCGPVSGHTCPSWHGHSPEHMPHSQVCAAPLSSGHVFAGHHVCANSFPPCSQKMPPGQQPSASAPNSSALKGTELPSLHLMSTDPVSPDTSHMPPLRRWSLPALQDGRTPRHSSEPGLRLHLHKGKLDLHAVYLGLDPPLLLLGHFQQIEGLENILTVTTDDVSAQLHW